MYDMREYDKNIKIKYNYDLIYVDDKYRYHNLNTGKVSGKLKKISDENCVIINSEQFNDFDFFRDISLYYWEATSDHKYLCCIFSKIKAIDVKKGHIIKPEEIERVYISNKKEILVPVRIGFGGEITDCGSYRILEKNKNMDFFFNYFYGKNIGIAKNNKYLNDDNLFFLEEFTKVFNPIYSEFSEWVINFIEEPHDLDVFLNIPDLEEKEDEKLLSLVKNYELTKIPDNISLDKIMQDPYAFKNFLYYEELDEDLFVIRKFCAHIINFGAGNKKQFLREIARSYFVKNKKILGLINNDGECIAPKEEDYDSRWKEPFVGGLKDITNSSLIYIRDILDEIPEKYKCCFIRLYIEYPVVEKLYRGGLKILVLKALYATYMDSNKILRDYGMQLKKDDFKASTGLNAYQIDKLKTLWKNRITRREKTDYYDVPIVNAYDYLEIYLVKYILGKDNISYIDNNSFDKILFFIDLCFNNPFATTDVAKNLNEMYGFRTMINMIDPLISVAGKILETLEAVGFVFNNAMDAYSDYLDMVKRLNLAHIYKPYFKDIKDIVKMHDEVLVLYNAKKDEFQKEAFLEARKRVCGYEYSNDKYTVITPEDPVDIVSEGEKLNHCVKLYIEKIIMGKTNIMFLRKTDDINNPYYTIEISNDGVIEQIHGINNSNIIPGSSEEAFLLEWCKKYDLKINDINKLR